MQPIPAMRMLLAVAVLAACQPTDPTATAPIAQAQAEPQPARPSRGTPPKVVPEPPLPPSKRFEHDLIVRYHMHGNLDLLRAIERLLIRGNLEDSRALARSIAEAPVAPDLGPWAAEMAQVRQRAAALAAAPGIDEACRREARLAAACASCHVETRIQPEFRASPPPPPDRDTLEARMARHRWAADRMWEGLIGAADDPWRAGIAILAAPPIHWKEMDERRNLAQRLQQLADEAGQRAATDTLDDRARIYGEMLVTCAACHTKKAPQ